MYILFQHAFVSFSSQHIHWRSKLWVMGMMWGRGSTLRGKGSKNEIVHSFVEVGPPGKIIRLALSIFSNLAMAMSEGHGSTLKTHWPEESGWHI